MAGAEPFGCDGLGWAACVGLRRCPKNVQENLTQWIFSLHSVSYWSPYHAPIDSACIFVSLYSWAGRTCDLREQVVRLGPGWVMINNHESGVVLFGFYTDAA